MAESPFFERFRKGYAVRAAAIGLALNVAGASLARAADVGPNPTTTEQTTTQDGLSGFLGKIFDGIRSPFTGGTTTTVQAPAPTARDVQTAEAVALRRTIVTKSTELDRAVRLVAQLRDQHVRDLRLHNADVGRIRADEIALNAATAEKNRILGQLADANSQLRRQATALDAAAELHNTDATTHRQDQRTIEDQKSTILNWKFGGPLLAFFTGIGGFLIGNFRRKNTAPATVARTEPAVDGPRPTPSRRMPRVEPIIAPRPTAGPRPTVAPPVVPVAADIDAGPRIPDFLIPTPGQRNAAAAAASAAHGAEPAYPYIDVFGPGVIAPEAAVAEPVTAQPFRVTFSEAQREALSKMRQANAGKFSTRNRIVPQTGGAAPVEIETVEIGATPVSLTMNIMPGAASRSGAPLDGVRPIHMPSALTPPVTYTARIQPDMIQISNRAGDAELDAVLVYMLNMQKAHPDYAPHFGNSSPEILARLQARNDLLAANWQAALAEKRNKLSGSEARTALEMKLGRDYGNVETMPPVLRSTLPDHVQDEGSPTDMVQETYVTTGNEAAPGIYIRSHINEGKRVRHLELVGDATQADINMAAVYTARMDRQAQAYPDRLNPTIIKASDENRQKLENVMTLGGGVHGKIDIMPPALRSTLSTHAQSEGDPTDRVEEIRITTGGESAPGVYIRSQLSDEGKRTRFIELADDATRADINAAALFMARMHQQAQNFPGAASNTVIKASDENHQRLMDELTSPAMVMHGIRFAPTIDGQTQTEREIAQVEAAVAELAAQIQTAEAPANAPLAARFTVTPNGYGTEASRSEVTYAPYVEKLFKQDPSATDNVAAEPREIYMSDAERNVAMMLDTRHNDAKAQINFISRNFLEGTEAAAGHENDTIEELAIKVGGEEIPSLAIRPGAVQIAWDASPEAIKFAAEYIANLSLEPGVPDNAVKIIATAENKKLLAAALTEVAGTMAKPKADATVSAEAAPVNEFTAMLALIEQSAAARQTKPVVAPAKAAAPAADDIMDDAIRAMLGGQQEPVAPAQAKVAAAPVKADAPVAPVAAEAKPAVTSAAGSADIGKQVVILSQKGNLVYSVGTVAEVNATVNSLNIAGIDGTYDAEKLAAVLKKRRYTMAFVDADKLPAQQDVKPKALEALKTAIDSTLIKAAAAPVEQKTAVSAEQAATAVAKDAVPASTTISVIVTQANGATDPDKDPDGPGRGTPPAADTKITVVTNEPVTVVHQDAKSTEPASLLTAAAAITAPKPKFMAPVKIEKPILPRAALVRAPLTQPVSGILSHDGPRQGLSTTDKGAFMRFISNTGNAFGFSYADDKGATQKRYNYAVTNAGTPDQAYKVMVVDPANPASYLKPDAQPAFTVSGQGVEIHQTTDETTVRDAVKLAVLMKGDLLTEKSSSDFEAVIAEAAKDLQSSGDLYRLSGFTVQPAEQVTVNGEKPEHILNKPGRETVVGVSQDNAFPSLAAE